MKRMIVAYTEQDNINQIIAKLHSYRGTVLEDAANRAAKDLAEGEVKVGYSASDYLNVFEWTEDLCADLEEETGLQPYVHYTGPGYMKGRENLLTAGIANYGGAIDRDGYDAVFNYVVNHYKKELQIQYKKAKAADPSLTISQFLEDKKNYYHAVDIDTYMEFGRNVLRRSRV